MSGLYFLPPSEVSVYIFICLQCVIIPPFKSSVSLLKPNCLQTKQTSSSNSLLWPFLSLGLLFCEAHSPSCQWLLSLAALDGHGLLYHSFGTDVSVSSISFLAFAFVVPWWLAGLSWPDSGLFLQLVWGWQQLVWWFGAGLCVVF